MIFLKVVHLVPQILFQTLTHLYTKTAASSYFKLSWKSTQREEALVTMGIPRPAGHAVLQSPVCKTEMTPLHSHLVVYYES